MFSLVSAFSGANGCGAGGWECGANTGGGSGTTKPAFVNPKPAFDFSKPGFVAPEPGLGAGGAVARGWERGLKGSGTSKTHGFIGSLGENAGFRADGQEVGARSPQIFPFSKPFCSKNLGFIGDFRPFGPSFPHTALPAARLNLSERFENQTLQPVFH